MQSKRPRVRYSVFMLIGIVAFGTSGYFFVERMPLFEAFYMTIITISTVGYAEIIPLTQAGRALTIVIIILGITVGAYTIGMLVRAFIEGEMLKIFGRRKVQKQITELKDHYIVCGFGRIGRIICKDCDLISIFWPGLPMKTMKTSSRVPEPAVWFRPISSGASEWHRF